MAQLATRLEEQQSQTEEKLALLGAAEARLTTAFKALSADALNSNNASFLSLAKASLETFHQAAKGDLEQRQSAIDSLVKPVRESLDKVDAKIQELEKAREFAYGAIKEQVGSLLETQNYLRQETSNLVRALRSPVTRGRWGEMQLKRVIEMAGMLDHCDFFEQESAESDGRRQRPDVVIKLPGSKNVVIDAKTPLAAYLEAIEAGEDGQRKIKLLEHARQVRNHIEALSKKSYWEQFEPTPEFVILFLPGESFFSAALEHDPALIEVGAETRAACDADHVAGVAEGRGLWLATRERFAQRARDQRAGSAAL